MHVLVAVWLYMGRKIHYCDFQCKFFSQIDFFLFLFLHLIIQAASSQWQTSGAHRSDPNTSVFTSAWSKSQMTNLISNSGQKLELDELASLKYFRDYQTPKFVFV